MIPLAPNLDHVGILARWVADVAAMLDVMAGADPREPGSLAAASGDFIHAAAQTARNQRIALIPTVFDERATAETQHAIGAAVAKLASAGARVEAVEVPPSLVEIVEYRTRTNCRGSQGPSHIFCTPVPSVPEPSSERRSNRVQKSRKERVG